MVVSSAHDEMNNKSNAWDFRNCQTKGFCLQIFRLTPFYYYYYSQLYSSACHCEHNQRKFIVRIRPRAAGCWSGDRRGWLWLIISFGQNNGESVHVSSAGERLKCIPANICSSGWFIIQFRNNNSSFSAVSMHPKSVSSLLDRVRTANARVGNVAVL